MSEKLSAERINLEQIKYTEEMNGEIIAGLKAEIERLRETLGRIAGCAGYPDDCEVECYNAMDGCEQRMAAMALGGEA